MRALPFIVLAALLAWPLAASAEIYRWTDASGRVHFTQDLSQVPVAHRRQAQLSAYRVRPSVQKHETNAAAPAARVRGTRQLRSLGLGRAQEIPFEKRGNTMFVYVRLNDRVSVPFIVDTGASDISIPAAAAARAGIRVGPNTPTATYQTANGLVDKPIVSIDSVEVNGVRVEGLRGSVSDSMQVGLLGGAFFNNFTFQVDPAAQIITLVRNPGMRAGRSEKQWRNAFRQLRGYLESQERYLDENTLTDRARLRDLEQKRQDLQADLDQLEREADRAEVPQNWREG